MRAAAPVLAIAAVLALAGCGSGVTKEQADTVCANLDASAILGTGSSGVRFAHDELQKKYGLSAPEASDAVREAVKEYCPQYTPLV